MTYEYTIVKRPAGEFAVIELMLNSMAAEGWRVVGMYVVEMRSQHYANVMQDIVAYTLEREVIPQ